MPDLLDRMYCSEQIHIPPTFPYIMKLYCKAAIRTQPYDLLKWSAAYFRALANGEEPPAKERIEYPPYDSPSGLTPGYIKILINQFGKDPSTIITAQTIFRRWSDICLQEELLIKLIALMGATTVVNWVKFVGICAGFICKTLTQTMILVCELFTEEPEGGMATVPYGLFIDLYIFLAQMECGPLTAQEKEEIEGIMFEEGICEIAEKIKEGVYEGEGEEVAEEETIEGHGEEAVVFEEQMEEESDEEEEAFKKDAEGFNINVSEDGSKTAAAPADDVPEKKYSESEQKDIPADLENEDEKGQKDDDEADEPVVSEKSSTKEGDSVKSTVTAEDELHTEPLELEDEQKTEMAVSEAVTELKEDVVKMDRPISDKPKPKKIKLEDLEETVRRRIEEKLAEEEECVMEEEDKEFEELSSYLLGAAARVQKYTAEALGYRIFKKYMRQEVPGIGPCVDSEQVEQVVNFMDYWSNKQASMVMPRNIRHWMCPPLDKVPRPEV